MAETDASMCTTKITEMMDAAHQVLDTSGMRCPLPVLKARKHMKIMENGDTLLVISTDPSSMNDFQNFCEVSDNVLLAQQGGTQGGIVEFRHLIEKKRKI